MSLLYPKKSSDKLLNIIIGTASILLIIHIALIFLKIPNQILAEIPMFIPMLYTFGALAALCIIIMSLGRQRVLNDALSYWTGIAFINILITNIFYILSWPGLLANGLPIIGNNTNTAAWLLINENILIAIIFLFASFISWPGKSALKGNRWTISVAGWTLAIVLHNILLIAFQDHLPLLVINNKFTILSKTTVVLLILIMSPAAVLMIRRYRSTKDQMTGFIALLLVLLLFPYIEQLMSVNRYDLVWYTGRLIGVLSYVVLLFGLLLEYINLYSREEEKSRGLIESEKRYRELVKHAPTAIYEIDFRAKKFTTINEAMIMLSGYSREELLNMNVLDILDDESKITFQSRITRMLGNEKPDENVEYKVRAKDGHIIYALLNTKFNLDDKGIPIGAMCIGHDITERKLVEENLKKSEEKFKSVLDNSRDFIYQVNLKTGRYEYASPAVKEIFGYSADEFIAMENKRTIAMVHPDDVEVVHSGLAMMEETGHAELEYRVRIKNGGYVWISNHMSLIRDSSGQPLFRSGNVRNITLRKESEIKLKVARDKLNFALENGNIGTWELDLKTNEASLDERLEKMFGLDPGTFGKTYDAFESLVNEEDIFHIRKATKNAIEKDLPYETVFRTRSENKKTKYISSKALINKDKDGQPVSMTGVCFDVTGLKEGTEQLISKLNEELLRSNKELESFAYVASHDLQEPLRMVSSFTQLLSKQYKDKLDDKAMEYIDFAVDGSKRMYDLLNGLLAYSRINTKGKEFTKVDLTQALEGATKNLSLIITEKEVVIKSEPLPVIIGDSSQMVQLFQNLISNSIKFSRESPRIYISSKSNDNHYLISVKDEGMGIEPQYFEKIFQIFQRLHPKDQYEGTGIGLSICKRIVERHGGKIWVESDPGNESTFFFTIPKNY